MSCAYGCDMQVTGTSDLFSWDENDIASYEVTQTYQCTMCGNVENIDVTAETICENNL